jgi:hypothetical protein
MKGVPGRALEAWASALSLVVQVQAQRVILFAHVLKTAVISTRLKGIAATLVADEYETSLGEGWQVYRGIERRSLMKKQW